MVAAFLIVMCALIMIGTNQISEKKDAQLGFDGRKMKHRSKHSLRLDEEDSFAALHEELGCNEREIVVEEEVDGEFEVLCEACKSKRKPNENKDSCIYPTCNPQTHFITSKAECEKCPIHEIPSYATSRRTGKKSSRAFKC